MHPFKRTVRLLIAAGLLFAGARAAQAEQLRLHYVPAAPGGTVTLQAGPGGPPGERSRYLGLVRESSNRALRPNYLVTFRHAYTGQLVTVPVTFPEGTPRLEYSGNRIIYNYGTYTVQAIFNPDGSVDMLYNSGPFRPIFPGS